MTAATGNVVLSRACYNLTLARVVKKIHRLNRIVIALVCRSFEADRRVLSGPNDLVRDCARGQVTGPKP